MNILVVNPILFSSERNVIPEVVTIKETMIYNMCMGFVANGHRVTLTASAAYQPVRPENAYDFEVVFFKSVLTWFFPPSVLPLSFDFKNYLKANHSQFDLVICSEVFAFYSLFSCLICPSKTVIWHEMTVHQKKFRKLASRIWHKVVVPLFMRNVRQVIPRSEKARLFIGKYMKNVSPEYVEHGINLSYFEFSKEKKRQLISSSQLIYRKNVESIIEIFSRLVAKKGYEDIHLLIAGRGVYRPFLEKTVARLNLQDHVFFTGFLGREELNRFIRESLAFLINTRQDLNMISIPESVVSGTPVITNLIPASCDYIYKEKLGIAKDDWNENDLIEIIQTNSFYVDNCIAFRDQLSIQSCAKKIVDIYLSCCNDE